MKYEHSKNYLAHHGVKGQRWGVRRYTNPDGTLSEKGMIRLSEDAEKESQYKNLLKENGKTAETRRKDVFING